MNPIFSARKDHEQPPANDIQMSPEMQHYSLDADHDGRVQPDDFEQARERILAPVNDDAETARALRKLRAEDILIERQRKREDALNAAIIEEETRAQKVEGRSPLRKGIGRIGDFAAGALRSIPAAQPQQPASRGRAPARAPARGHMRPEPAPASMGQRFNGVNNAANSYGASLMPRGTPAGFSMRQAQGGDQLKNFTSSLLGRAPAPKPQAQAPRRSPTISIYVNDAPIPKKNLKDNPVLNDKSPTHLKNDFMGSMLFGGTRPAPSRAPAPAQAAPRAGKDMLKNFGKSVGGVSMVKGKKGKENKPYKFGGF